MEENDSAGKNNRHSYPEHIQFLQLQDRVVILQGEMGKQLVPAGTNQGAHLLFPLQMGEDKKALVFPGKSRLQVQARPRQPNKVSQ